MEKRIIYPKNSYLYQGLANINSEDRWFTSNIEYSCIYTGKKNGIVKIYYTNDYINLINIENMNENDFPDYKDISINDVKKISLRDIFKIIFGKGQNKLPTISTIDDIKALENYDIKYKDTQYGKFYELITILGKKNQTIKWLKKIINMKERKIITDKNSFNRISDALLDNLFLDNLKKYFPNIVGYYATQLSSDWNFSSEKKFLMLPEIAIYNMKYVSFYKIINNTRIVCDNILKINKINKISKINKINTVIMIILILLILLVKFKYLN